MTFLTLICAFALEQWRSLHSDNPVYRLVARTACWFEQQFNVGEARHGRLAWWLLVLAVCAPVLLLYGLLCWIHPALGFVWTIAVLFFTLGFRQFSHFYTDIQKALRVDGDSVDPQALADLDAARQTLAQWQQAHVLHATAQRQVPGANLSQASQAQEFQTEFQTFSSADLVRKTLCMGMLAAHRHVFAVLLYFVLLPGPLALAGIVLYRLAEFLARRWNVLIQRDLDGRPINQKNFGRFAQQAFALLDWLPARVTAATLALVGNFEDALHGWTTQTKFYAREPALARQAENDAIILATAAGAMGVALLPPAIATSDDTFWQGGQPEANSLRTGVGLVWRAVVLWLGLLGVISLAYWVH